MRVSLGGKRGGGFIVVLLNMGWVAFVLLKENRVGLLLRRCLIEAMHDAPVELQDSAFCWLSIRSGDVRPSKKSAASIYI